MTLIDDNGSLYQAGSRQSALIALQVFLVSIALIVFTLRVYTRAFILRSLAADDYIMGLAMLTSIGIAINSCVGTRYGWGLHASAILPQNLSGILLTIWISELLFTFSTSLVKLSILFFYLRLAVTKTYKRVIYASIAFIAAWDVTFSFIIIFQCHPVSSYWIPTAEQCLPATAALFIHGLTNTFTDIYVYILPMRLVWGINLPKRQRIGLIAIFGFGFLVCVAGGFRLYYAVKAQTSSDSTWQGFDVWTWESVEVNLGIVCASAPCLKSLITRLLPRIMGDSTQSKSETFPGAAKRGNPAWGNRAVGGGSWTAGKDVEAGLAMKMGTVVTIGSGASSNETLRKGPMTVIKERSESQDGLKDSVDVWK